MEQVINYYKEKLDFLVNEDEDGDSVYGLKVIPTLGTVDLDNADLIPELFQLKVNHVNSAGNEFSSCNRKVLKEHITGNEKLIIEIGVARSNWNDCSTKLILDNKADDCIYIGLDIEDRTFVETYGKPNTYILKVDSRKVLDNWEAIQEILDVYEFDEPLIDLLLIDGDHSINMVTNDWKYTEFVKSDGLVFMHDTNSHPGPYAVFECIDENMFDKKKYCEKFDDWGIAVVRKK